MLVIGIGSSLRRDYGVGLVVARRLKAAAPKGAVVATLPPGEPVLPDEWGNHRTVVMVTAMKSGAAPGTVARLDGLGEFFPAGDFEGSIGMPGVTDIIGKARTLSRLPAEVIVYGIEIEDGNEGPGLTLALTKAAEKAALFIRKDLGGGSRWREFIYRHRVVVGAGVAALILLISANAFLGRKRVGPNDETCVSALGGLLGDRADVIDFRVLGGATYWNYYQGLVAVRFACVIRLKSRMPDLVADEKDELSTTEYPAGTTRLIDGSGPDAFSHFLDTLSRISGKDRDLLKKSSTLDIGGEGVVEFWYMPWPSGRWVFSTLKEGGHWREVLQKANYRW